jgi:hypothetical protein
MDNKREQIYRIVPWVTSGIGFFTGLQFTNANDCGLETTIPKIADTVFNATLSSDAKYIDKNTLYPIVLSILIGYCAGHGINLLFQYIHAATYGKIINDIENRNDRLRAENNILQQRIVLLEHIRNNLLSVPNGYLVNDGDDEIDTSQIPDHIKCPITRTLINDPVYLAAERRSYERTALQAWYDYGNRTTPFNNAVLDNPANLPTNAALQSEIAAFRLQHKKQTNRPSFC